MAELEVTAYCGRLAQAGFVAGSPAATMLFSSIAPAAPIQYEVTPLFRDLLELIAEPRPPEEPR
jgi:hypothetical protein